MRRRARAITCKQVVLTLSLGLITLGFSQLAKAEHLDRLFGTGVDSSGTPVLTIYDTKGDPDNDVDPSVANANQPFPVRSNAIAREPNGSTIGPGIELLYYIGSEPPFDVFRRNIAQLPPVDENLTNGKSGLTQTALGLAGRPAPFAVPPEGPPFVGPLYSIDKDKRVHEIDPTDGMPKEIGTFEGLEVEGANVTVGAISFGLDGHTLLAVGSLVVDPQAPILEIKNFAFRCILNTLQCALLGELTMRNQMGNPVPSVPVGGVGFEFAAVGTTPRAFVVTSVIPGFLFGPIDFLAQPPFTANAFLAPPDIFQAMTDLTADPNASSDDDDGDGVNNGKEIVCGSNIRRTDTDDDTLSDSAEINTHFTDPADVDTDDDGLSDAEEVNQFNTSPLIMDSDGDLIPDGIEAGRETAVAASEDPDGVPVGGTGGNFTGDQDPTTTTNPLVADTDGDGATDGQEDSNQNGRVDPGETDPNDPEDTPGDDSGGDDNSGDDDSDGDDSSDDGDDGSGSDDSDDSSDDSSSDSDTTTAATTQANTTTTSNAATFTEEGSGCALQTKAANPSALVVLLIAIGSLWLRRRFLI